MKKSNSIVLLLFFTLLSIQNAHSQATISQAQSIFIYNFTRLIEWPADSKTGDFIIGVYGSSEEYSELKTYTAGKMVGNQNILIKKMSSVEDISGIHILFVAFGKTKELPTIVNKIGGSRTLIITEKSGGLEQGATINFVIVDDKLRYEVKTSNATKIGLKYHSNLETMSMSKR